MARKQLPLLLGVSLLWALGGPARAEKPDPKGVEFFESKIRPVLVKSCYECHSAKSSKVQGGLLLDSRDGVRQGGDTGPAVVPGKPEDSLLIRALRHDGLKMPPKSDKLPDSVVADFTHWVRMGAPDPRDGTAGAYKKMSLEEARDYWSFKPLSKSEPPKVRDASWAKDDIDRFVLARRQEKRLQPAADADRHVLIRRLSFDLVGLPPTPEEVEAFVKDNSPQALEKVVDRLLDSPHFGERWGRHWLDLARYAESNGNADNTPFPLAHRYRDYVIAAFNRDKPYDQFIREQIAGDLLPAQDAREKDEHLIATGFLALTSKPRAQNNPDFRMDLVADQVDVTSRAVLGLSVMCARCHDHKFDPIPTREYYALAGIFDSTQMLAGAGGGKGGGGKNAGNVNGVHALSDGGSAMGVKEGKPTDTAVCVRGDSTKRGETPQRGFLTVATLGEAPKVNRSASGRLELAQWLTSRDNPLTARVAVNRVWLHLFGQGLVKSPDNFGSLGEMPSHPELLDHLASRFIESGWSTKKLVRAVVLSRSYRMSSAHDEANCKADPDNVGLWRMNGRRLEAEPIRDAMLAVAGTLDRTPPKGSLSQSTGGKKANYSAKDANVRSVYLGVVRGAPLPELLALFDVANPNLVVAQREVTTVPAQSLFLMNSPWVADQGKAFARRVLAAKEMDDAGRVALAYRLALSRSPTEAEQAKALAYVGQAGAGEKAWAGFCQALFASAEFRYVQ